MSIRRVSRGGLAAAFGLAAVLSLSLGLRVHADDAAVRAKGHLAAGEFAAAAAAAGDASDLQQQIAEARRDSSRSGFFQGAGESRGNAKDASDSTQLTGTGADFNSLIELIQDMTTGPWMETTGTGAARPQPYQSGVRVDPRGVLTRVEKRDLDGRLAALGTRARKADLNQDIAATSDLRLVSLTRLEREVAARIARGERILESMQQLAGLSEVRYVLIDKAEGEILIGGPADAWDYDAQGLPVGRHSGRPTLRLDDFVVVLRSFEPQGRQMFGCSIDPREAGLKAVKSFVEDSQRAGPLSAGQTRGWAQQIGETLGRQDITVFGVPEDSRVARVMVEADYRMKLIGVGKLEAGGEIPSYFDLLARNPAAAQGGLDALRWWLTLNTEEVLHNDGRNAFELRGLSVKCLSENQFVTSTGERASTGKAEPVNRQFAENFTQHYAGLAASQPVFADLEGVFDLALAAALIRHERLDERTGWNRGVFAADGAYLTARYTPPKEVDSVVNYRVFHGKDVVVQVAGGVRADVLSAITDPQIAHESAEVARVVDQAEPGQLPAGRWWWDVAR